MHRSDFYYVLPPASIAQYPLAERAAARLLCVDGESGQLQDRRIADLPELLGPGDLLVFNDTRVIPARLDGSKATGGAVEVLVERVLDERRVLAHCRASKAPQVGAQLELQGGLRARVCDRRGELFELTFAGEGTVLEMLEACGQVPLPPYIARPPEVDDAARYQTVYARHPGAVAAPTAGLHFDQSLLEQLRAQGVDQGFVTLHVGAGTFQPVRDEALKAHRLHPEYVEVAAEVCEQIRAARHRGGRVVAVGTTVVRSLETAVRGGTVEPYQGETELFILPGYRFASIDVLITNFHLPASSLLMLVCAFGGYDTVMAAYGHAVDSGYRFYSYGDAMWITPVPEARA